MERIFISLEQKLEGIEVVEAFDINTLANQVYFHNFGKKPKTVQFLFTNL
jgi:hypothetical protein